MQSRQTTDVVLQALRMAVWRRKPKGKVLIHSDQGSQFTSEDWAAFLWGHNLVHSMSRRGNCHDNTVVESFFNLLKRERIRRRTYKTREEARQDVFDCIEMFDNQKRKHTRNGMLSPVEFERQRKLKPEGVWKTRRYADLAYSTGQESTGSTKERLDLGVATDGSAWVPWSEDYAITRHGGQSLLIDQGYLQDSIQNISDGANARVGAHMAYGAIHQEGGQAGRGKKTTIPARPYPGLSEHDRQAVETFVLDQLAAAFD